MLGGSPLRPFPNSTSKISKLPGGEYGQWPGGIPPFVASIFLLTSLAPNFTHKTTELTPAIANRRSAQIQKPITHQLKIGALAFYQYIIHGD